MPVAPAPSETRLAARLAARTLELIDIPSESHAEAELAAHVARVLRDGGAEVVDLGDSCVLAYPRETRPQVLLAGHLDTVPAQGNIPGHVDSNRVYGLGASDMQGALAVMIEFVLERHHTRHYSSLARSCRRPRARSRRCWRGRLWRRTSWS